MPERSGLAERPRFTMVLGGADPREVERVIAAAHVALADTLDEIDRLRAALEEARAQAGAVPDGPEAIIHEAETTAQRTRARARRAAARVIYKAEEQAQTLVRALELDRDALRQHVMAASLRQAWGVRTLASLVDDAGDDMRSSGASLAPVDDLTDDERAQVDAIAHLLGQALASHDLDGPVQSAGAVEPRIETAPAASEPTPAEDAKRGRLLRFLPRVSRVRWVPGAAAAAAVLVLAATTALMGGRFAVPERAEVVAAGISGVPVRGAFDAPALLPGPPSQGEPARDRAEAPAPQIRPPAGPTSRAPVDVRVSATRECWVRITRDDRVEERLLAAGSETAIEATRIVKLRIGDAGAVRLTVNGTELPALGRDGRVIERRFTPEP